MAIDIILASASPRRKKLLEDAGVAFRVDASDVDETLDEALLADPHAAAQELAQRKAASVVQHVLASKPENTQIVVIGADTMVVLDGHIFGKPHSASEGKGMLRKLSGRTHEVITGVSVWLVVADEAGNVNVGRKTFEETSLVTFRELDDNTIAEYLRKGESYDKAGAYAIQGAGAALVDRTEGDYDNIVGLPVGKLLELFPDLVSSE
ncbi:MAG: septum formation protein Maf [Eggerthellaceae bacterium]|nr:septum formation protein Maf [Eggerthellaceae bacterium]